MPVQRLRIAAAPLGTTRHPGAERRGPLPPAAAQRLNAALQRQSEERSSRTRGRSATAAPGLTWCPSKGYSHGAGRSGRGALSPSAMRRTAFHLRLPPGVRQRGARTAAPPGRHLNPREAVRGSSRSAPHPLPSRSRRTARSGYLPPERSGRHAAPRPRGPRPAEPLHLPARHCGESGGADPCRTEPIRGASATTARPPRLPRGRPRRRSGRGAREAAPAPAAARRARGPRAAPPPPCGRGREGAGRERGGGAGPNWGGREGREGGTGAEGGGGMRRRRRKGGLGPLRRPRPDSPSGGAPGPPPASCRTHRAAPSAPRSPSPARRPLQEPGGAERSRAGRGRAERASRPLASRPPAAAHPPLPVPASPLAARPSVTWRCPSRGRPRGVPMCGALGGREGTRRDRHGAGGGGVPRLGPPPRRPDWRMGADALVSMTLQGGASAFDGARRVPGDGDFATSGSCGAGLGPGTARGAGIPRRPAGAGWVGPPDRGAAGDPVSGRPDRAGPLCRPASAAGGAGSAGSPAPWAAGGTAARLCPEWSAAARDAGGAPGRPAAWLSLLSEPGLWQPRSRAAHRIAAAAAAARGIAETTEG